MRKLESGSGIGFTVIIDGEIVNFKLGVFARKTWGGKEEMEYGFISDSDMEYSFTSPEGLYSRGTYFGGITGMGVTPCEIKNIPGDMRLVTTDLDEINKLAGVAEDKAKQEKEVEIKTKQDKVKRINALPRIFPVGDKKLDSLVVFKRSDASYNSFSSRRVEGGSINLAYKNADGKCIWLSDYLTKDGKLQVKKFAGDLRHLFGDRAPEFALKATLRTLVDRQRELTMMINKI